MSNTDGTTGNEITGIGSGTYTVTVTDCSGATQVGNVYVNSGTGGRGGRGRGKKTALIEELANVLTVNPNPFAEKTVIEFATATDETVSVDVFTVSGQHVSNLFEGQTVTEETHRVVLNGSQLQAGTYIVRLLTQSGAIQYQKVVLMK